MIRTLTSTLRTIVAVAACALLTACVSAPSRQAMTPTALPGGMASLAGKIKPQPYSVAVRVTRSGSEVSEAATALIGEIKAAIETSIRDSKAFREVVPGPGAQYELSVSLLQTRAPMFGLSTTVDLEMGWTLVRISDNSVAFRRTIGSTHTAGATEAFAGVERVKLAYEGAVRKNVAQGLVAMTETGL